MKREAAQIRAWLKDHPTDRAGARGATRLSNLTDNDSAKMATDKGVVQGYCAVAAVDEGLLKVMSKMGISVLSSYRGGYNFEAVGLSRTLVADVFPGMPSRISGIGLNGIQRKLMRLHREAWAGETQALPVGGLYRFRRGGERHAWEGDLIHTLQTAVATDSYTLFKKYTEGMRERPAIDADIAAIAEYGPYRSGV